jgi:hypothetical protein
MVLKKGIRFMVVRFSLILSAIMISLLRRAGGRIN